MLRQAVADAWEHNGHGRTGFEAMAKSYVQFAVGHPSHYRVMFGGFIESATKDEDLMGEARAAFQVLVDAIVDQQNNGLIRRDDPCWSLMDNCERQARGKQWSSTQLRESTRRSPLWFEDPASRSSFGVTPKAQPWSLTW
jgi:hypothetical protein